MSTTKAISRYFSCLMIMVCVHEFFTSLLMKSLHFQAHLKDVELLNNPIENYQQMEVIFGNGFATGKYAMGSSEPLGSPSDFAESSLKIEELTKVFGEEPKKDDSSGGGGSAAGGGDKKRKRSCLGEHVMSSMTSTVNNVA